MSAIICDYQHWAWTRLGLSSINHWFIRDSLIAIPPCWVIGYWGSQGGLQMCTLQWAKKASMVVLKQGQMVTVILSMCHKTKRHWYRGREGWRDRKEIGELCVREIRMHCKTVLKWQKTSSRKVILKEKNRKQGRDRFEDIVMSSPPFYAFKQPHFYEVL